ncbi:hypothetical protein HPB48_020941 [Haemaphysalis longicornis]|uniref:Endothelin-converting enzyme n=1 Tax=Haemaphysalis longicornis TaxID=44386 RepID=A0A9J6FQQ7_HAELO|nr:hypothetical protein HPB48_020941 [Haemaphysalis longicornis]
MLKACMANRSRGEQDSRAFRLFMKELNLSWPDDPPRNVNALAVVVNLAFNWQVTFWISLKLVQDRVTPQRQRLLVSEGNRDDLLVFARNHAYLLSHDAYVQYWKSNCQLLLPDQFNACQRNFTTKMYESASIQGDVIKSLLAVSSNYPKSPVLTTVGEMGMHAGGRLNSSEWELRLREVLQPYGHPFITNSSEVLISDTLLLESIGRLFTTYSDTELVHQMSWEFVQRHISSVERTPLEISFGGRRPALPDVALYCALFVENSYRTLIVSAYAHSNMNSAKRQALDADLRGLLDAAVRKINASLWLKEHSKRMAVEKMQVMTTRIWPPEQYLTVQNLDSAYESFPANSNTSFVQSWVTTRKAQRRLQGTPLQEVTDNLHPMISFSLVDYDYLMNEVRVAISALASPVYYAQGTRSMFYGGLGFLYAFHALKAIDSTGRRIAANGKVAFPWLSTEEATALDERGLCQDVQRDDTFLTSLAALEVSLSEFQATRSRDGNHATSANLTEDQVFFSTLCRLTCGAPSNRARVLRCNDLVKNVANFAAAFHCPRGSPMNPRTRCRYFD